MQIKTKLLLSISISIVGLIILGFFVNTWIEKVIVLAEDLSSSKNIINELTFIQNSSVIAILCIVFFIILSTFFTNGKIIKNINSLKKGMSTLEKTATSNQIIINSKDELSEIASSFNTYISVLEKGKVQDSKVIDEVRVVIGKVNVGLFNERIKEISTSTRIQALVDEINHMIDKSYSDLSIISDTLLNLGNAKYDKKVPTIEGLTGLTASILSGTKMTQSTINEVIALIDNSNKKLAFSAQDLSDSSIRLSNSSNEQAAALEETAAAIEEVSSTISQSSESASKMALYAKNVTNSSKSGIELAKKTSVSMDELSIEVNTIKDAITIIDQIAFQTNILSLNAAVEAATAGEAGKGFAVVAQEVRNLASRSAEAANEIKNLVESANNKAMEGKKVASQMIEGFSELNENIDTTISLIDSVASASKEQELAMNQINDTVNSLDQTTQRNASLANNISEMAATTQGLTNQLQTVIDRTSFDATSKKRVCDTEKIFDFAQLKCDHIKFKNNYFAQCESGKKIVVKTCHECNLGKWIDKSEKENAQFVETIAWQDLKSIHSNVHHIVQDIVDLYKDDYDNGQIISVTQMLENQIDKIFVALDNLKEVNCDIEFKKRGA